VKADLIAFTQKLLQTPSMSCHEEAVCRLSVAEMERLGYDRTDIDGAGNAIGIVKGADPDAPVIALNSHLDHVDPGEPGLWEHDPYSGDIADGKIYGRGASDTKGAFAVQVYALAVLKRMGLKPKGDVYVTGVVMEEVGGFGTRYFLEHTDRKPDCVILGEGTENNIKLGHRAGIRVEIHRPQRRLTSYTGLQDPCTGAAATAFKLGKDNPFVQKAVSVITRSLGRAPALGYWLFGTDGRFMAEAGIPTYGFSPCEEPLAHTADDHIKIDMMMDALYCYPRILI